MKITLKIIAGVVFLFVCFLISNHLNAQKVSDILEHGQVVKNRQAIILKFEGGKFYFDIDRSPSKNFDPLKDDTYFLVMGRGANTYLAPPLNPINYSVSSQVTFTPDQINKDFSEALGSILESLGKLNPGTQVNISNASSPPKPKPGEKKAKDTPVISKIIDSTCIKLFLQCKSDLEAIASQLKVSKLEEANSIFNKLQELDFIDKTVAESTVAASGKKRKDIADYYEKISDAIEKVKKKIKSYSDCTPAVNENFINTYVMNQILKDENDILKEYNKHLTNLSNVIDLVSTTMNMCEGQGKDWYLPVKRVSMEDNKIGNASITIYDDGYSLTKEGAIVKKTKKELNTINLKFRKFQRIIPEVSAGIAYTNLRFTKYDVDIDQTTGKKQIIEAGEDKIRNLNFTSMINFTYYTPNSVIHPFWQLGVGANAGFPTLLTGVGARINAPSLKRLAISMGFAGTWIKNLTDYKVGQEIKDAAELEKDLKYVFSFPLKPYLGIQINF